MDTSKLTAGYWFTTDNASADVVEVDDSRIYSAGAPLAASASIQNKSQGGQDRVEITSFPGGRALAPNQYIEYRLRIHKSNWSNYSQANDFSFAGNYGFSATSHVPVYYDGSLVFGTEP